jgi:hypothetical protein
MELLQQDPRYREEKEKEAMGRIGFRVCAALEAGGCEGGGEGGDPEGFRPHGGGGCVLPLTPYNSIGHDYTALSCDVNVACIAGECVVHGCLPGYLTAHDGTYCVSKHEKIS